MEYIGIAGQTTGQSGGGGGGDFDMAAWAPYIGGGFVVVFLVVMFGMRRR